MKRQWKLMLCLSLAALTLCGCSGQQSGGSVVFDTATQYLGPVSEATPTSEPFVPEDYPAEDYTGDDSIFSQNPYDIPFEFTEEDALNEENYDGSDFDFGGSAYASADVTVYPYAGSTPIPLNPVDMPSPTPRPAINFTYVPYSTLGLTFEAPVGWIADESMNDVFSLSEPAEQIKDNQLGVLTISAVPVNNNYDERDLKAELKNRLDTIGSVKFVEWKPKIADSRHLLGGKGVYNNYSGTLADGTKVGGRVHYACVDNKLYCLEIVYPLDYADDFLNVFSKVRTTLKIAK